MYIESCGLYSYKATFDLEKILTYIRDMNHCLRLYKKSSSIAAGISDVTEPEIKEEKIVVQLYNFSYIMN